MFKRDTTNFDRENFILDLLNVDWPSIISGEKKDPNYSTNSFEDTINSLLDKYLPLKKLTKKEFKQQFKPWITFGIRESMRRREKLYKKFINAKNVDIKEEYNKA